ncbi:MAG: hypothetical protein AB8B96_10585 [Lysobacterales bacterium]
MTRSNLIVHLLSCLGLLLLVSGTAFSAPLSGLEIVKAATAANGGDAWRRPQTLFLEGRMTMYSGGGIDQQTQVDTYRMWRKFPAKPGAAHAANGKVAFDARSDGDVVFQISWDGSHTYNQNGRVEKSSADAQWSAAFGFGIIRFADQPGFSVSRLADDQIEGHPCYMVKVTDAGGSETLFGIDQNSLAVRMVGFDTPRGWHHRIYSAFAWHSAPKFRQPQRVRLFYDGRKTNDIFWHTFRVNGPLDDGVFALNPESLHE